MLFITTQSLTRESCNAPKTAPYLRSRVHSLPPCEIGARYGYILSPLRDWCPLRVYSLSPSAIGFRYGNGTARASRRGSQGKADLRHLENRWQRVGPGSLRPVICNTGNQKVGLDRFGVFGNSVQHAHPAECRHNVHLALNLRGAIPNVVAQKKTTRTLRQLGKDLAVFTKTHVDCGQSSLAGPAGIAGPRCVTLGRFASSCSYMSIQLAFVSAELACTTCTVSPSRAILRRHVVRAAPRHTCSAIRTNTYKL
eukprot:1191317-Prorocentrum_minimum.AAC.6